MNVIPQNQIDREPLWLNTKITPLFIKANRCRFGIFIVYFEHISQHFLVFLLLNLSNYMLAGMFMQIIKVKRLNHPSWF